MVAGEQWRPAASSMFSSSERASRARSADRYWFSSRAGASGDAVNNPLWPGVHEILAPVTSTENLDRVREVYAEWGRGNMKAGPELFDPELVFESFLPD